MRPLQQNDVFHAIAHPARRTILVLLKAGDRRASALAEPFGISFAAISQHLKVLKDADLVSERREGRQRIYQLRPKPLEDVVAWVDEFELYFNARLDALAEHLDRKHGSTEVRTRRATTPSRDARRIKRARIARPSRRAGSRARAA